MRISGKLVTIWTVTLSFTWVLNEAFIFCSKRENSAWTSFLLLTSPSLSVRFEAKSNFTMFRMDFMFDWEISPSSPATSKNWSSLWTAEWKEEARERVWLFGFLAFFRMDAFISFVFLDLRTSFKLNRFDTFERKFPKLVDFAAGTLMMSSRKLISTFSSVSNFALVVEERPT